MKLSRLFQLWLFVYLFVSLTGCGDARLGELRAYIAAVKQRPPQPLEPVPAIKQIDNFIYEDVGRRDPFMMDEQSAEALEPRSADLSSLAPDPLRRKEPLEQYALDSLRMVGTLEQDTVRWGLVVSPDNILHRVRVGNYLGQNYGRITRIQEQAIDLTEVIKETEGMAGEWRERQASIALMK
ncbi:pilus assembly protein PilP [Thiospirillum jenense]|uniref:Pilus assembly protein PilP n=1 Tax=Thiospirillum jenense TaxID=1653858 RepID=A0A839H889_9GAMM|nr:pilus assembly protein PilP [Thiospirillum jenense]MBB1125663.1 pilus assembly protein PilP [Thiospirillum jenense]